MDESLLGSLALNYELIDEAQLERCLELQETTAPPRYLGEILVAEGHLSADTLRRLLSAQRKEIERQGGPEREQRTQQAQKIAPGASLRTFLELLEELGGDELHLGVGARPSARIHGVLKTLRPEPVDAEEGEALCAELLDESLRERLQTERSLNRIHEEQDLGRYRVNLFQQRRGPACVLCRIPSVLPSIEELGLPPQVQLVPRLHHGLVLITGPTASGKTTTLAALVELLNTKRRKHVVCLEETTEFVHTSRHSLVTQIEIGQEPEDWERSLFDALRLDPDVIVAGDLDIPARLAIALRAAETGHLVLGTLPASGAEQALLSIIRGCGVERREQVCTSLARLLRWVFCQQLVPGAEGQHLACEVLRNTPAVANMIREQRLHQLGNVIQTSREQGMIAMDDSLLELVRAKRVSAGDALARAADRERLYARLQTIDLANKGGVS